jgi:hypothetical protein
VNTNGVRGVRRCGTVFLWTAALVLSLTAAAKIFTLSNLHQELETRDPLFYFLNLRSVLFVTTGLEIACVLLVIVSANYRLRLACVAWLSTLFLLYRLGLLLIGYHGGCLCLGKPESWVTIASYADPYMKLALAYLLVSSYCFLFEAGFRKEQSPLFDQPCHA